MDLIQILKALSDESRLRILNVIREKPLCVCEIEEVLNMSQSNVSRHLSKLVNAKIVIFYKKAKYVYYEINKDIFLQYDFIEKIIMKELVSINDFKFDLENLDTIKDLDCCTKHNLS
ncbi:MAG: metalloregulator ArsR/SmtB family transcription factor [Peptostreptococcaceae bacterium]